MGLFRTGFAFRLVCGKWLKFVVMRLSSIQNKQKNEVFYMYGKNGNVAAVVGFGASGALYMPLQADYTAIKKNQVPANTVLEMSCINGVWQYVQ
ncbi:hypothetical protein C1X05_00420 [Laceyella sacchari]|uniref:Uncharacterized protein n=2 Tax=Laceyella TaxID=292635 RepID=A0AA46AGY0_9BACL|nr:MULTISPECIES: hypothetical protein [Laceyella]AUS07472.1 hypothetical protein C1X05_00420 [Laceyella sacchari]PRZ16676.1 hypothetical protein CLV36_102390 [Laceyella sediminis]SMP32836.1 hypothetical protein SAMN06265361_10952 [Laceyella tengchongensis]